ncbi:MAG: hypothetical protein AB7U61_17620 [Methylocystis sp.]
MLRLSRSKVISEIEFIVDRPIAGIGPLRWEKNGVTCAVERHSYRGDLYSFDVEIMRVHSLGDARRIGDARKNWELLIVTEHWRNAGGEHMHMGKWLKLTNGNAVDVKRWIANNREIGLSKTHSTLEAASERGPANYRTRKSAG